MTDDLLTDDQEITVALQNENIWKEFHDNATEMLVTRPGRYVYFFICYLFQQTRVRNTGRVTICTIAICSRQLFPKLAFKISGLDEKAQYKVTVIITRSDNLK